VKTRLLHGPPCALGPFAAIGTEKRRRVRAMAREWLAARPAAIGPAPPAEIRFDAIGVTYDERGRLIALDHLEDAF
jgi:Holliday junction resolvase-like predicted endonuclease